MTELILSPDQRTAVEAFAAWYEPLRAELAQDRDVRHRWSIDLLPRFTIGGLAGTGKSTIVAHLLAGMRRVRVVAFTGKAAYVLRCKGISGAQTIHSTIYELTEACSSCELRRKDCLAAVARHKEINYRRASQGRPQTPMSPQMRACVIAKPKKMFALLPDIDADLVIVDEASMVSRDLLCDLQSFGLPILFVGDHGQLEPIGKDPNLMKDPNVRLERIHRQAADNPIIQFAHHVRSGREPKTMGSEATVRRMRGVPSDAASYDAVLCGYNRTRKAVNAKIRRDKGFTGDLPQEGERVVCLRNDRRFGIFNGMQATVLRVWEDVDEGWMMKVVDDLGKTTEPMPFHPDQFEEEATMQNASRRRTLWDFGYCLTVHKSQGSEWDRVLVLEQISPNWSADRWRYTAATRAAKQLTYCIRG